MAPKRACSSKENGIKDNKCLISKPDPKRHWSRGLVASIEDPEKVVFQDPLVTVIKDAYPKAKHHFLVLPNEDISGLFKLDKSHISLLRHMENIGKQAVDNIKCSFRLGYHSIPSMQRLHLHVISNDMVSDCLKTKIHWNSFNTDFFIQSQDLINMVKRDGCVKRMSEADHKAYMATPLKCHKCNLPAKNMPTLKAHILSHQ